MWVSSMAKRRPGGKESVLAAIAALPERRESKVPTAEKVATDFDGGGYGIIVEAAKIRRLSLSAYLRRSAYAMACHDLDIPFSVAMARDSRVSRDTGVPFPDPDGTRFGVWEIEGLVGEDER